MTGQLNGKFTKNAMYLSLPLLTALKAVLYTLCKKKKLIQFVSYQVCLMNHVVKISMIFKVL